MIIFLDGGISPVNFSLKEPVISYTNQTGHNEQKIHGIELKRPSVINTQP